MTSADAAITKRAFRQLWIGASVCGLAFGATAASSALSYASSFSTAAARQQLVATTSTDRGLAILLGPISGVDTVGGYTVYKGFVFLTTIGALWAILAATRVLRGEEDSGRWQLVLAGSTRAVARHRRDDRSARCRGRCDLRRHGADHVARRSRS